MSTNTVRVVFFIISLFVIITTGFASSGNVLFTTSPTISPDCQKVVFCYEGDLWIVDSSGGNAFRLTGMQGEEKEPRFSPDGKWIAFSGSQDGNFNIYVMPVNGGEIRQLTFHDGHDRMDSWSWDSKYIFFNSNRYNLYTAFKINASGGSPERLFENFFNTVHGVVQHPVSNDLYFTDSWESLRFAQRKRYKGDHNPDIKSYNVVSGKFTIHTSYKGKDLQPTIDEQGNIYFVSDRLNGEYNLYSLKEDKKLGLTTFDSSIKTPQVAANGKKIVFEKDYRLFIYDTASQKSTPLEIQLPGNLVLEKECNFDVKGKISNFSVAPDGKKMVFVSRGFLFVSDIKGKFVKRLNTPSDERVYEVEWLKDNKTILYTRTVKGWSNLFTIRADTNEKEVQITFDQATNRNLNLDHSKSRALYISGRDYIKLLDLNSLKSKSLLKEELWGLYSSQPTFSPNDEYIVFTAFRNFETDIFLYNFKSGKTVNITNSGTTEGDPRWSPDGKYLFFAANRTKPDFPSGNYGTTIFRLPMQKYDTPFRSNQVDKLFSTDSISKNSKSKPGTAKPAPEIVIDFQDMYKRWEQVSPSKGSQGLPYVFSKIDSSSGKSIYTVLYISTHDGKGPNIWKTVFKPFSKPKTDKINGSGSGFFMVSKCNDKFYSLLNGNIGTLDLSANKFKPLKIRFPFKKDISSEFKQMYFEVWTKLMENFYDGKFHGIDWVKMGDRYAKFLPHVRSRANLRTLINDLQGELNASHLSFKSTGTEEKTFIKMTTKQIGLMFSNKNPFEVKYVVADSPADKVSIDIKPGDVLVAVNGKPVSRNVNREFYFTAPVHTDEMALTFKRGGQSFSAKIHPGTPSALKTLLYDEWIHNNQQRVDKKSNRRIAYVHMKNMLDAALQGFLLEMTTEHYNREALILDLRYNRGGNVHDAVLNFLSQRPHTQWKYRGGAYAPQPNFAPAAKPIVLLINEKSLSDAEMTAVAFKQLKMGRIIGTESYRWLIFTTDSELLDGSTYRIPCWGCYYLDKTNIETEGVKPDLYIKNTFKDRVDGNDPQLDAAIDEILKKLPEKK